MLEVLVLAAAAATGCGYDGATYARGLATDIETSRLAYCEYHLPAKDGQRRVLYYSPAGFRIAEKLLTDIDGPVPEVTQQDFRHGEERSARRSNTEWLLTYRERTGQSAEVATLPAAEVDVVDAGFDTLVRQQWDRLAGGQAVTFRFASPAHGRAITLRAQQQRCEQATPSALCIRVDLAQPLLRMFAGELNLVYERSSRRLLVFEGVSNLLDKRGDSQRVRIEYTYPE